MNCSSMGCSSEILELTPALLCPAMDSPEKLSPAASFVGNWPVCVSGPLFLRPRRSIFSSSHSPVAFLLATAKWRNLSSVIAHPEYTSMLEVLSPRSAMPIDLAMQLYLPPPFKKVSYTTKRALKGNEPLRSCIHLHISEDTAENEQRIKEQKRVSFADTKGLPLTTVKFFDLHDLNISFNVDDLISSLVGLKTTAKDNLLLDFAQPSSDYLDFKSRIETDSVCLENCMLQENTIRGTVKVKNIVFEKSLKVRITFDTWKSLQDHDCRYVQDSYGGSDKDTFAFEIHLPEYVVPHERIEFAICYESGGKIYWDSNKGQNYRLIRSELKHALESSKSSLDALLTENDRMPGYGIEFDHYGGLRCSYGLFPEWPSYAGYDKMGPYY